MVEETAHAAEVYYPTDTCRSPSEVGYTHLSNLDDYRRLYDESINNPSRFWGRQARELLTWTTPFDVVHTGGFSHGDNAWFSGGRLNASVNCLDRHMQAHADRPAMICFGDEPGTGRTLTYGDVLRQVSRVAHVLRNGFGVRKGDVVAIYLPMLPETLIACLACARLGAIHSVIFAGFSAEAVRDRVKDASCRVVITLDQGRRGGKTIAAKTLVDQALASCPAVTGVLVLRHTGSDVPWTAGRDYWWHEETAKYPGFIPAEPVDAEDPLFLLYTSGSTGKPKGVVHATGGYLLGAAATGKYVFDLHPADCFFCACDIGWITGHTYGLYAPLLLGATTVVFEGVPSYPNYSRYWDVLAQSQATHLYLAPTALRVLKRAGDAFVTGNRHHVRVLGSVGEPIAPDVWRWYYTVVGETRAPVIDTYWQTETGSHTIAPLAGMTPLKPGSASLPFFGIEPVLLDPVTGEVLTEPDIEGAMVFRQPWPSLARTIWGSHDQYMNAYLNPYKGYYFTGDAAIRDKDGYYWIRGRIDDVINVSGHRISTAELEAALLEHPNVAESAVVASYDDITGQAANAFVVLQTAAHEDMVDALRRQVRLSIGPFATPKMIYIVRDLPKTRSGKILRRVLRKVLAGEQDQLGDMSTLADPSVIGHIMAVVEGSGRCRHV